MKRLFALGLSLVAVAALGAACSSKSTECDCIDPSLRVSVPAEAAAEVIDVRVSGAACTGVAVTCAQQGVGGCASWRFAANATGTCHVEVSFAAGTSYTRDVTIAPPNGCCTGFYPDPESAGEIDVTPPGASGPADAAAGDAASDASSDADNDAGGDR